MMMRSQPLSRFSIKRGSKVAREVGKVGGTEEGSGKFVRYFEVGKT